jgi:hypothetical protein
VSSNPLRRRTFERPWSNPCDSGLDVIPIDEQARSVRCLWTRLLLPSTSLIRLFQFPDELGILAISPTMRFVIVNFSLNEWPIDFTNTARNFWVVIMRWKNIYIDGNGLHHHRSYTFCMNQPAGVIYRDTERPFSLPSVCRGEKYYREVTEQSGANANVYGWDELSISPPLVSWAEVARGESLIWFWNRLWRPKAM